MIQLFKSLKPSVIFITTFSERKILYFGGVVWTLFNFEISRLVLDVFSIRIIILALGHNISQTLEVIEIISVKNIALLFLKCSSNYYFSVKPNIFLPLYLFQSNDAKVDSKHLVMDIISSCCN